MLNQHFWSVKLTRSGGLHFVYKTRWDAGKFHQFHWSSLFDNWQQGLKKITSSKYQTAAEATETWRTWVTTSTLWHNWRLLVQRKHSKASKIYLLVNTSSVDSHRWRQLMEHELEFSWTTVKNTCIYQHVSSWTKPLLMHWILHRR